MITLSPSQDAACDAFRAFLKSGVKNEFVLTGAAGTGKSFLVTYLLDLVRDEHKLVKLIAPQTPDPQFKFTATTHKAANVLAQMTGQDSMTTHSCLGLRVVPNFSTGKSDIVQKEKPKDLTNTTLIVDEASMINSKLLHYIRKTRRQFKNTKILYVGDKYQLAPVGENICSLFEDENIMHELTDVQRQAAGSPIIQLGHAYREILDDPQLPWPKIQHDGQSIFHYKSAMDWRMKLRSEFVHSPHAVGKRMILAWSNSRVTGYNSWLRKKRGLPPFFMAGDYVVCNEPITNARGNVIARNDSHYVIQECAPDKEYGVVGWSITASPYKGDIPLFSQYGSSTITVFQPANPEDKKAVLQRLAAKAKKAPTSLAWDADPGELTRNEWWEKYWEVKNGWADFRTNDAQTVHKSQGSTYEKVFIDLEDIGRNNKWYEVARLMYVATTRASTEVHLYGELPERYTRQQPRAQRILSRFKDAKNQKTYST